MKKILLFLGLSILSHFSCNNENKDSEEPTVDSVKQVFQNEKSEQIIDISGLDENDSAFQAFYIKQWPQFRGPFASGIIESTDLPESWNIRTGKNIKWKIKIPGLGHSCPVIWDDKLFLTTAISLEGKEYLKIGLYGAIDDVPDETVHEYKLYCINKYTGEIIWEKQVYKGIPGTKRHTKSSHANCTPATNGKYIVAFFGSDGLYCYDFSGNFKWKKNYDKMKTGFYRSPDDEWGFASSPIVHENRVIVQCDFMGNSFLESLDIETGKLIWRTYRDECSTWSTPNYYQKGDNKQIVVNGYKHIGGYDFDTGKEIWKLTGGGDLPVPTPIFANDLIYIHNAHGRYQPIIAIKPNAKGEINLKKGAAYNKYIAWHTKRGAAYIPTNLIYGDYLYNMRMNGILTCYNAQTGSQIYEAKIPESSGISASGVASDGKIYYSTEHGNVYVIKAGPNYKLISKNKFRDFIMATPAISENVLYFRSRHYLTAVGK